MNKIRVTIQQPALPKFRVPFFRLLSEQDCIDLNLFYSSFNSKLPNEKAVGFNAKFVAMSTFKLFKNHPVVWHSPQWTYAKKTNTDVLVLTWDLHYVSLLPSMMRAKINKVPVVLWGHGFSKKENVTRKFLRESVAKLASAIILYDHQTAKSYIESGFDKNKIFVAPNSLDQNVIKNAKQYWSKNSKELFDFQKLQGVDITKTIIYIGRIFPDNKLDILFKALTKIKTVHSDIKLVIIGKGDEEQKLKALATSLGLDENIIWTGALYDETDIAKWMLSATMFCYPENIGLSIMHAFGYSLPVITSDHISGHNPEIFAFKNGMNGLFYKKDNNASLSEKIIELLDDPILLDSLSEQALSTVDEFNMDKMVEGFVSAIQYARNT